MKKFIERLLVYAYWPWGKPAPRMRAKNAPRKALTITSSACPAPVAKFLMPDAAKTMRMSAAAIGDGTAASLHFGMICTEEKQRLSGSHKKAARSAALKLLK